MQKESTVNSTIARFAKKNFVVCSIYKSAIKSFGDIGPIKRFDIKIGFFETIVENSNL